MLTVIGGLKKNCEIIIAVTVPDVNASVCTCGILLCTILYENDVRFKIFQFSNYNNNVSLPKQIAVYAYVYMHSAIHWSGTNVCMYVGMFECVRLCPKNGATRSHSLFFIPT